MSIEPVPESDPEAAAEAELGLQFRRALENVAMIALALDRDGCVTFANDFLLELTGWNRAQVIGSDWFTLFEDDPRMRADYARFMQLGVIRAHFQGPIRTRSGELREISWSSILDLDQAGEVGGIVAIGEDVTEQRRAEELLRSNEEFFRTLIENASDMIAIIAPNGASIYESPSVERVLGRKPEEVVGVPGFPLLHPGDADLARTQFAAILAGEETAPVEFRLQHRNGSWRICEGVGRRLRHTDGQYVVLINYRDVTDQRELQEQLLHAQKLEAVGRLAGGIAHDFNNLLTAIGGYGDFLASSFDDGDPRREDAQEIIRASERAAALTRQLLAFSRRQVLQTEVLDFGEILGTLDKLLSRVLGADVEVFTTAEAGCLVRADRGQLEQVITNLAVNARDAMPDGGRLELAVRRTGGQVELLVRDTGHGIDAEILPHIFEPFFTTKPAGKGTGLGLATVYGIVAQSGGEVSVVSDPARGTVFRVLFPQAHDDRTPKAAPASRPAARDGTESILLAEDEDTIRRLVCEVLIRSGYSVHAEATGDAALEWLQEHADGVDLLLTDIVMPGSLSGPALARAALLLKPSLRVLYTSGYANEPDEALESPDIAFIGKPFLPQELVAKVREVLDGA
jgi:PAS domain S-box-containing protein